VQDAQAQVGDISQALNSGRHTTTTTQWYWTDASRQTALIDSPGFQEFGLYHLSEGMLERAFRDFQPYLGGCRFYNCRHLSEPQCAVLDAVAQGKIAKMRHTLYGQLLHESSQTLY